MADTFPAVMLSLADDGESSQKPPPKKKTMASRLPRLHVRADEGAELNGVSLATWWRWDAAGSIPQATKIGGVKLWPLRLLKLWSQWGCPDRREFVERLAEHDRERETRRTRKGGPTR